MSPTLKRSGARGRRSPRVETTWRGGTRRDLVVDGGAEFVAKGMRTHRRLCQSTILGRGLGVVGKARLMKLRSSCAPCRDARSPPRQAPLTPIGPPYLSCTRRSAPSLPLPPPPPLPPFPHHGRPILLMLALRHPAFWCGRGAALGGGGGCRRHSPTVQGQGVSPRGGVRHALPGRRPPAPLLRACQPATEVHVPLHHLPARLGRRHRGRRATCRGGR